MGCTDPLKSAAASLAIATDDSDDHLARLRLAGSVLGEVESLAMGHASALAQTSEFDPMQELDAVAFPRVRAEPRSARDELWSMWCLSRSRAHLSAMLHSAANDDVAAAAALLDAARAILSASAHRRLGKEVTAEQCREQALQDVESARAMLAGA
jgi:hypothetical protein